MLSFSIAGRAKAFNGHTSGTPNLCCLAGRRI
jgi:hypothetical protein